MDDRPLHIVLVEDDEVDVMNVQRAFERNATDHPLFVAGNGIEALELLRSGQVGDRRLVLLDLNMPRMNGIEFLTALRADPKLSSTAVLVLTTSNEDRDRQEAWGRNVAGYLVKPVTFSKFVSLMETVDRYWAQVELP
jgi:CheY-like chemotaxis protein